MHDIKNAVTKAQRAEAYEDPERPPRAGTTCWRVLGFDFDKAPLNVGVDLSQDHLGSHALVVTVF